MIPEKAEIIQLKYNVNKSICAKKHVIDIKAFCFFDGM